jgi:pimeloyl-ACP methyl ester carboxylesterase
MKSWGNNRKKRVRGVLIATLCLLAIDARAMERILVEPDVEIEYTVRGRGPAVVLVHAGLFAGWFKPLLEEKALTKSYRVVSFHRVGYAGSSRIAGAVSIARQAQHVATLMRHLGIERAHVVGHSSGANIALQLALDAPQRVQSLALLEPALPVSEGSERLLSTRQTVMAPILESYRGGDKSAAVDGFMRMVSGPAYRTVLDRALPGEFARGVADADTFFQQELPAIMQWRLAREDAARIKQPALAVMGERSKEVSPIWEARHQQLLSWLPNAEGFVLPGATHLLQVQDPQGMAVALTRFFARHPL